MLHVKETSEYDPYVIFVPGARQGMLHVIINALHPYYQSIESSDALEECMQQFVYDSISEYHAGRLQARIGPDSVRRLKDMLLRARFNRIQNADAEARTKAEEALLERVD